ncbi:MAG TPA: DUF4231 domain-containing protein [Ilumatobacteraceae bacterium]|nr:DUF4231 domain-containing protein [Ilumatobacteraceae bacterium]
MVLPLFTRLPLRRPVPGRVAPIAIGDECRLLGGRIEALDRALVAAFADQELIAVQEQTRHRRFRLVTLVLAALTSVLGAVQATAGDVAWPGLAIGVVGLAAAGVSRYAQRTAPLAKYLTSRARAEQLRALYFRYLGGLDGDDERQLEVRIAQVVDPMPHGDGER